MTESRVIGCLVVVGYAVTIFAMGFWLGAADGLREGLDLNLSGCWVVKP